jgi:SAM-dependent methyltransferase
MLQRLQCMGLFSRLLGHPLVYDVVRPLVVGGVDMDPLFRSLESTERDVIVDIGCGTGVALRHLRAFHRYLGIDPDPAAVARARSRFGGDPRVRFEVGTADPALIASLAPTRAVLAGVLHHVRDPDALAILGLLRRTPSVARVVTLDIVYLEHEPLSNALAALDRGRFCRRREGYEGLARAAGWSVRQSSVVRSHPTRGRALYLLMVLEPW